MDKKLYLLLLITVVVITCKRKDEKSYQFTVQVENTSPHALEAELRFASDHCKWNDPGTEAKRLVHPAQSLKLDFSYSCLESSGNEGYLTYRLLPKKPDYEYFSIVVPYHNLTEALTIGVVLKWQGDVSGSHDLTIAAEHFTNSIGKDMRPLVDFNLFDQYIHIRSETDKIVWLLVPKKLFVANQTYPEADDKTYYKLEMTKKEFSSVQRGSVQDSGKTVKCHASGCEVL